MTLTELKAKLDHLSPAKIRFVANVVESLSNPPRASIRKQGTWITSVPDWIEYFGLAISVHHGATTEPLGLKPFEAVFRNACESVDWTLDAPGSSTRRFIDLVVQAGSDLPRRLSLKSTAAQRLSQTRVHISKLTEGAWIQDARTPGDRRRQTLGLFREYQQTVDAIIMLRAFRTGTGIPHRYQLLEISSSLFDSVQQTPVEQFRRDAPIIDCIDRGRVVGRVAIDRSDAKITVRSILLSACTVHAEWVRSDD